MNGKPTVVLAVRGRALANVDHVREALKLLREAVLEDRKQILLRVAFVLALMAFTLKDLWAVSRTLPAYAHYMTAISFIFFLAGAAIYLNHHHKAIGVVYALSMRIAYADLGFADLEIVEAYWQSRKLRWYLASWLFFLGCILYASVIVLALVLRTPAWTPSI